MTQARFAWLAILALCVVALTMALTGLAHSAELSLADRIALLVPAYASKKEEAVDARELAEAIAEVSKGNRQWAAFLLALAHHESGLRSRIARSDYRAGEGDGGRAWGLLQVHRSTLNAQVWGSLSIADQIREGSRIARGAYYQCKRAGVEFPLGVFRAMGGRGCSAPLKGEEQRLVTFNRVLRKL